MNEIIIILLIVCIVGSIAIGINESIDYSIFGRYLPNDEVNQFFDKHLGEYELNSFDKNMLVNNNNYSFPYITNMPLSIFSKYYVRGYGQIWRWSAATKRIDEKFKELKIKEKKLSDL